MSTARTADVVHHLYPNGPAVDLVPYCGALTGDWNTGHDRETLLQCLGFGLPVCMVCASPGALGGFTPLILSEDGD